MRDKPKGGMTLKSKPKKKSEEKERKLPKRGQRTATNKANY